MYYEVCNFAFLSSAYNFNEYLPALLGRRKRCGASDDMSRTAVVRAAISAACHLLFAYKTITQGSFVGQVPETGWCMYARYYLNVLFFCVPARHRSSCFWSLSLPLPKVMDAITGYRISYSRFRQGFHRGAKGEISAVTHFMTAAHAKFMPV